MRRRSQAYLNFRQQVDDLWNFAVMICYAVPSLSKTIKGTELNIPNYSLPKPDFFKYDRSSFEVLKQLMKPYQKRLAIYLWISVFSFFEAYVMGLLEELIEFHGGKTQFAETAKINAKDAMSKSTLPIKRLITLGRLHKPVDRRKIGLYTKYSRKLNDISYRFPSELLSSFGVKMLIERVNDLKAKDIPLILKDGFNFDLDPQMERSFISFKDKRNNIAHGNPTEVTLKDVKDMYHKLKKLAFEIDEHLMNHFFILELFR